jgi:hypothetical protein
LIDDNVTGVWRRAKKAGNGARQKRARITITGSRHGEGRQDVAGVSNFE